MTAYIRIASSLSWLKRGTTDRIRQTMSTAGYVLARAADLVSLSAGRHVNEAQNRTSGDARIGLAESGVVGLG